MSLIPSLGQIVEKVCDALLPDDLEFVGDLAGGAADLYTGNYAAAVEHTVDLVTGMTNTGQVIGRPIPDPPGSGTSVATQGSGTSNASPAKGGGTSMATSLLPNFFSLSDKDFMKAIRDGAIPKEVLEDKGAMIRLQERMNRITEMNQLITQVTQAMHQMSMSVISNCRV